MAVQNFATDTKMIKNVSGLWNHRPFSNERSKLLVENIQIIGVEAAEPTTLKISRCRRP